MTLLANGIRDDLELADAFGVAGMLVSTGRAVPASQWVDSMIVDYVNEKLEAMY